MNILQVILLKICASWNFLFFLLVVHVNSPGFSRYQVPAAGRISGGSSLGVQRVWSVISLQAPKMFISLSVHMSSLLIYLIFFYWFFLCWKLFLTLPSAFFSAWDQHFLCLFLVIFHFLDFRMSSRFNGGHCPPLPFAYAYIQPCALKPNIHCAFQFGTVRYYEHCHYWPIKPDQAVPFFGPQLL